MSGGEIGAALIGAAANMWGANQQSKAVRDANASNISNQRDFAKNSIQWKVDDAVKAGIHPLAALGAQTHSFSPSSTPDGSMGQAMSNIGQDIGRAVRSVSTAEERAVKDLQLASLQEDVKHKQLLNQQLNSQIARENQPGTPPAVPKFNSAHDGLGPSQGVLVKPSETTATMKGQPAQEAGIIPDVGWVRTSNGGLAPVASKDVKERIEDSLIPETQHAVRNLVMPNVGRGPKPPQHLLPEGYDFWKWNWADQEYQPARTGSRNWDKNKVNKTIEQLRSYNR